MTSSVIVAGELQDRVWCPSCNAPVRIRIPLHLGHLAAPVAAHLEICVSCGHHYIPSRPVVEVVAQTHPWWRRFRPAGALLWRLHRHLAARDGRTAPACAYRDCKRPGWHNCCLFEQVEFGTIRWVFCSAKHRAKFLGDHVPATI